MSSYLERYQQGEFEQVWAELVELGADVWKEPLHSDAWNVACETMRRARSNIEVLIPRLQHLGYQFGESPEFPANEGEVHFLPSPPYAHDVVEALERLLGPIPLSVRAWYELVGAVDLVGFHPDWPDTEALDPLVVDFIFPIKYHTNLEPILAHIKEVFDDWQTNCEEYGIEDIGPFQLEMAPDSLHKVGCSGGPAYGINLPHQAADTEWLDGNGITFVAYLRQCFRHGGFPATKIPSAHLDYLVADLLPL